MASNIPADCPLDLIAVHNKDGGPYDQFNNVLPLYTVANITNSLVKVLCVQEVVTHFI